METTIRNTHTCGYRAVTLTPDRGAVGFPMESGLFGHNVEVTRKGFFRGLCAQMLNNRKLFMGNDRADGWECTNARRITDRPEESLCHSRFVILKNGCMKQSADTVTLQAGKRYEAKVWVKVYSEEATVTFGVDGYEASDCTEIRVEEFSFTKNGYEYIHKNEATVSGYSILFCKLTAI